MYTYIYVYGAPPIFDTPVDADGEDPPGTTVYIYMRG